VDYVVIIGYHDPKSGVKDGRCSYMVRGCMGVEVAEERALDQHAEWVPSLEQWVESTRLLEWTSSPP
jgi:hypothetical protein